MSRPASNPKKDRDMMRSVKRGPPMRKKIIELSKGEPKNDPDRYLSFASWLSENASKMNERLGGKGA